MINFIFQPYKKGWFKALGVHHFIVMAIALVIGHFVGVGDYVAVFGFAWFASREITEYQRRGNTAFELMDFLSPAIIAVGYLGLSLPFFETIIFNAMK